MEKQRVEHWLASVHHTQDEEISCTECFDLVSSFVDLELSGADPAASIPEVGQHLHHCPTCRDEYETLLDLRRLEDSGNPPSLDALRDMIT